jgi:hypothetical protein
MSRALTYYAIIFPGLQFECQMLQLQLKQRLMIASIHSINAQWWYIMRRASLLTEARWGV